MNLLILIAIVLVILWALGLFAFHIGSLIWALLLIALVVVLYDVFVRRRSL